MGRMTVTIVTIASGMTGTKATAAIVATVEIVVIVTTAAKAKVRAARAMEIGAATGDALNAALTISPEETNDSNAMRRSLNKQMCRIMKCSRGVFQFCSRQVLA